MADKSSPSSKKESSNDVFPAIRFILRFERFGWDAAGIIILVIGLLTMLGLLKTGGPLLNAWAHFLRRWFGWGSILIVFSSGYAAWMTFRRRRPNIPEDLSPQTRWGRILALEGSTFAMLAFLSVIFGENVERAEAGNDGGLIGWAVAELFASWLPHPLAGVLFALIALGTFLVGIGQWRSLFRWIGKQLEGSQERARDVVPVTEAESVDSLNPVRTVGKKPVRLPAEFRKNFRYEAKEERNVPTVRDERLPPFDFLTEDERSSQPSERNINLTAGLIEKTFAEFGIPAKVVGFQVGPTITQFAVEPGFVDKPGVEGEANRQKVRVAQISALSKDLTLALSATRLRVEAPVPGRPFVGIEVPNANSSAVHLRPLLESERFQQLNSPLALALGRDVSGKPVVGDLEKMPHMLIAGTTGSGKSVCIAALTLCLVMNNTPQDLRMVMIDPKMVELIRFNGLPHLLGKVETDAKRILGVLNWAVAEMERRYRLLEESRSRNISSYNRKMQSRKSGNVLPRIVIMIDELADLMMAAPDQTEHCLVRLAQMARATGIHLIVATQRPSTDIVTGLIKANFPARLSFAVASSIDSRVILDTQGAEALLGRGDMLFLPSDAPAPIRSQGAMVTDAEIERIINFWKTVMPVDEAAPSPWEELLNKETAHGEQDGLFEQAIDIIRQAQRANISLLQRRLRIGYPRAARLMDDLEEMGLVGPADSRGERDVLIEPDIEEE
jgi:S-DNA-T family DNA segregation ATPase FtsK/SpoIIIE